MEDAPSIPSVPMDDREQALPTLRMALRWRLPADRWGEVAGMLSHLLGALRAGDTTAFREAAGDLVFLAPSRQVTDVDGLVTEPAPPKIHERLNSLIHTLTEPPADVAAPAAGGRPERSAQH
jgi:hypothetical protein